MLLSIYIVLIGLVTIRTCPLKTVDSRSGCYCGIEIDGTNYIRCQPYSIDAIPEFTRSYVHDTLNLSFNFIRTINNQSWHQLKVKKIYLEQNLIESIDRHAFQSNSLLNYLEELYLDTIYNGSLEFLCYGTWSKLRRLALNGFNFQYHQSCVGRLTRLETLIIRNSQFDQLSHHIYKLVYLHELILTHNQLEYLHFDHDLSSDSSSLRRLDLSYNQLRTIPNDLFHRLSQLNIIDLSHNLIENLPIFHSTHDLHINLSHNFIQYLPLNDHQHVYDLSFNPLCTLETSELSIDNINLRAASQLHCDCRLAYFLRMNFNKTNERFDVSRQPFGNETRCSTPMHFHGYYLKDLTYQQLLSMCTKNLPNHCREVQHFEQIQSFSQHLLDTMTVNNTSTTTNQRTTPVDRSISSTFKSKRLFD
jgi:hypothetical protein